MLHALDVENKSTGNFPLVLSYIFCICLHLFDSICPSLAWSKAISHGTLRMNIKFMCKNNRSQGFLRRNSMRARSREGQRCSSHWSQHLQEKPADKQEKASKHIKDHTHIPREDSIKAFLHINSQQLPNPLRQYLDGSQPPGGGAKLFDLHSLAELLRGHRVGPHISRRRPW